MEKERVSRTNGITDYHLYLNYKLADTCDKKAGKTVITRGPGCMLYLSDKAFIHFFWVNGIDTGETGLF